MYDLAVAKSTESIDDYLKAILELAGDEDGRATSNALARQLGISAASVTGMLRKLATRRPTLIDYKKHHGARLTQEGQRRAMRVIRRHRLMELFLCEVLGFSWDEVHEEAERLEHVMSQKLENRIAEKLRHPEFDPHGQVIPRKDGTVAGIQAVPLNEISPGETAIISSVSDHEPEVLRDLATLGLTPGRRLTVMDAACVDGPITLRLGAKKGHRDLSLGRKLARSVLVERS
jgi:DtxR family Mn-dependent transcriptional regulator